MPSYIDEIPANSNESIIEDSVPEEIKREIMIKKIHRKAYNKYKDYKYLSMAVHFEFMDTKLYQSQVYGSGLVEKRLGLCGEIDDNLAKYKPGPIHKTGKKIKIKNMQKKKRPRKGSFTIEDLEN